MKLRPSSILFLSIILSGYANAITLLNVNTTNDEFGENLANCSLREAVESINTRNAFGGCIAGERFGTNRIVLEAKEYFITRGEIIVNEPMTIAGYFSNDLEDNITGLKPRRLPPQTILNAQNKNRIFNSSLNRPTLTLNHLKLINGYNTDYGGAVLTGGALVLFNVILEQNFSEKTGGAIYLLGSNSSLNLNNVTFQNNKAKLGHGSIFSMSCFGELKSTERTIDIKNTSIIKNGDNSQISTIEGCGNLTLNIENSTIGENSVNNNGAIIRLTDNIYSSSSINIKQSTLINNQGSPLKFDKINSIVINNSIIAFNTESCINTNNDIKYIGDNNFFQNCTIFNIASTSTNSHALDDHLSTTSTLKYNDLFNPLGNYGGFTQTYLPKTNNESKQYVVDQIKLESCQDYTDQRGSSTHTTSNVEPCDRGSVEKRIAIAVVDKSTTFTNDKESNDRIIEVNVLANDIPSETDLTDENEKARGGLAKDSNGNYLIKLTNDNQGKCTIRQRTSENLLPYIRFDNGGKLLTDTEKETCKYSFIDTNGNQAIEGSLLFKVQNRIPIAGNDSFSLPAGARSIQMNLTTNDNDKNDGKYGKLCTENSIKCNGGYYIRIVSSPQLGTIEGDSRECPDHSDVNKYMCYKGDLTYNYTNTLASFNDSFTYVVYDDDLAISEEASVTINSEAAAAAKDTGGSLAWWSLLSLAGLALYRRRNIKIA